MRERSIFGIHDNQGWGSKDPSGCGWWRVCLPIDQLQRHGWATGYAAYFSGQFEPSIVVGQRFDQAKAVPVWAGLRDSVKLVYEIDDNPFTVDAINWMAFESMRKKVVLDTIRSCAELSHLVTVTTEPLAEVFREFNPNVAVIPNFIPESMLTFARPRHEQLTIGWGGGSSHLRDLAMIAQAWRDVVDETGSRGHFVGVDYRNMLRPHGFDHTTWETDPAGYHKRLDFDIGLAPIADSEFSRSKSNIKCLEYAALGIPVIASDCEAYRDFVQDGVTGFLCRTPDEWREAMRLLVADAALRKEMGTKAQALAAEWTIEKNWTLWDAAYATLLEES